MKTILVNNPRQVTLRNTVWARPQQYEECQSAKVAATESAVIIAEIVDSTGEYHLFVSPKLEVEIDGGEKVKVD